MSTGPNGASRSRCRSGISRRHLRVRFFCKKRSSQREIPRPGYFDVAFRAAHDSHGLAKSLDETRFVRAVVLVLRGALERFLEDLRFEHLRRLRQHEVFTRQCRLNELTL